MMQILHDYTTTLLLLICFNGEISTLTEARLQSPLVLPAQTHLGKEWEESQVSDVSEIKSSLPGRPPPNVPRQSGSGEEGLFF